VKKHEKSAVFDFILITILLLFAGFIVFLKIDNSVYRIRDGRSLEDFSTAWYTDDNKEISLEDIGKSATKNSNGEPEIYVYHTIPAYLVNDTILNFRSKNLRFQVIIGDEDINDTILNTEVENLDIIPSNVDLSGAEIELLELEDRERTLRRKISEIYKQYDYILIDCPPSLSLLTINAFMVRVTKKLG